MIKKPKNRLREWFDTLFYGILIAIGFRSLFLEPFNIPSGSMIPTLHIGDHIFITKWSYGYSRYSFPFGSWHLWNGRIFKTMPKVGLYINGEMVERRDPRPYVVAVLPRSLRSTGYYYENMQVRGNKIYVDGAPANFNYTIEYKGDHICRTTPGLCGVFPATEYTEVLPNGVEHSIIEYTDNGPMDDTMEFLVPAGHLFFMGDNRDNSNDSRADVGFVPVENMLGRVWFVWYSHNYASPMVAFWNWNAKMRWNRFGKGIK